VLGNIAVQDTPTVMRNDEEAVENADCQRRYGEEVHRSDGFPMIAQKCCPSHCQPWTSGRFPHPPQHRTLRNIEAEHHQLAMNAWRTPSTIVGNLCLAKTPFDRKTGK
jgi:hypothetical protein